MSKALLKSERDCSRWETMCSSFKIFRTPPDGLENRHDLEYYISLEKVLMLPIRDIYIDWINRWKILTYNFYIGSAIGCSSEKNLTQALQLLKEFNTHLYRAA